MFDFAWSEIALIGVVALIAIGPKDMPVAMRTVANMVKKARRMAGEFQTHVDEMMREANLDEVRSQINEIRNFDIKGELERAVDSDGSLRETFTADPFNTTPAAVVAPVPETAVAEAETHAIAAPEGVDVVPVVVAEAEVLIAFVPPEIVARPTPPAFVPPELAQL